MEVRYSEQAQVLLENFKDFNKADFEKWFLARFAVGGNNILEYIMFKKQIEAEKKKLEDMENGH